MSARPPRLASALRPRRPAVGALLAACVGCDQATKSIASSHLPLGRRLSIRGDVVRLERLANRGPFLGLGEALFPGLRSALFTWGVSILVLLALTAVLRRRIPVPTAVGAALVAAGGMGNLLDR